MYTEDTVSDDKNMFITELHCFKDLIVGLYSPCEYCGLSRNVWVVQSLILQVYIKCFCTKQYCFPCFLIFISSYRRGMYCEFFFGVAIVLIRR